MSAGITIMQTSLAKGLEDLHTRVARAVLALDPQALDWRPAPEVSSVHELVVRAAYEERRWIAEGVVDAAAYGDCAFQPTPGVSLDDHPLYRLGCAGQISQTILATLTPAAWAEERQVDDQPVTVAGCVLHVLEDLARTLGQIEVMAQWWKVGRRT